MDYINIFIKSIFVDNMIFSFCLRGVIISSPYLEKTKIINAL